MNEDPELERLHEFESLCQPLPFEDRWHDYEEDDIMKLSAMSLFFDGCIEFSNTTVSLDEIRDGISDCFICRLRSPADLESYGKGKTPAVAVLSALVHMEVEMMIHNQ